MMSFFCLVRINNARMEDSGKYTCTAVNAIGQDYETIDIRVEAISPVSVRITGPNEVKKNDGLELRCEVVGSQPRPAVTYTWFLNEEKLSEGSVIR